MTTIYEISYLGTYYYSRTKPPKEGSFITPYIVGLVRRDPIDKRTIASHLEIKSTALTVIRQKKSKA